MAVSQCESNTNFDMVPDLSGRVQRSVLVSLRQIDDVIASALIMFSSTSSRSKEQKRRQLVVLHWYSEDGLLVV